MGKKPKSENIYKKWEIVKKCLNQHSNHKERI